MLELYIYVPKPVEPTTTLRGATAARIQEKTPRVAGVLSEQGIAAGPATQNYMAITQARLPDEAHLLRLTTRRPGSCNRWMRNKLQWMKRCQGGVQLSNAEYHLVHVRIQDVPDVMQVNSSDIRAALGIPSYSLRPPFRPPTEVVTSAPADHMDDTDHLDT
ncbi:hypothetical protein PF002_g12173 [Phytophthora fragariae]|uniref:Uncharacterized protein n=1 Tax=Phytophthora fragariae TaxID=53985 RepID=A0A6A3FPY6_9STRA|nr:hypothetical protein PF003_g23880 [Phytophthora fragariae]KAE8947073.1 hypothetical protein PF009_g3316 [Phytophthora fragariae]KAE9134206.1 hypothetical protein PF007_g3015 [Phytophthora fragariae]KAE9153350.1 hypothetical protein PF006_g2516 [Phytophthora fragariae]KAE9233134.1 hypothetical protein PF002_g12173 [Phytophthora fragariae]